MYALRARELLNELRMIEHEDANAWAFAHAKVVSGLTDAEAIDRTWNLDTPRPWYAFELTSTEGDFKTGVGVTVIYTSLRDGSSFARFTGAGQ